MDSCTDVHCRPPFARIVSQHLLGSHPTTSFSSATFARSPSLPTPNLPGNSSAHHSGPLSPLSTPRHSLPNGIKTPTEGTDEPQPGSSTMEPSPSSESRARMEELQLAEARRLEKVGGGGQQSGGIHPDEEEDTRKEFKRPVPAEADGNLNRGFKFVPSVFQLLSCQKKMRRPCPLTVVGTSASCFLEIFSVHRRLLGSLSRLKLSLQPKLETKRPLLPLPSLTIRRQHPILQAQQPWSNLLPLRRRSKLSLQWR